MIPQTANKIRQQMTQFLGRLSVNLSKPARRFVNEAVYGVQARQSVHLTEIARSLEENIPLIKTENRLSRNLARPELRTVIGNALLREGAQCIAQDTLLVLDLSDIVKPYAQRMEYLARVRDGSTGEISNGYWLCQVIGVENEGHAITPLYSELYSQKAKDFVSENVEIIKAIHKVSQTTEKRGLWVIDRGGDRRELYSELVPPDKGLRFIIRQKGNRHLLCGRRRASTLELAMSCPLFYSAVVVREEKNIEKACHISYGFRQVRLPEHPDIPLWLVVVQGFGQTPLILLTNVALRRNRKVLWRVVSSYLTRWRIEETIRFGKQSYRLEDVRVLTYDRLRNLVTLVLAAMFFTAVVLGNLLKLRILSVHVLKAAQRLFGIPDFRYYALSDGIKAILTRFPNRSSAVSHLKSNAKQYLLFDT